MLGNPLWADSRPTVLPEARAVLSLSQPDAATAATIKQEISKRGRIHVLVSLTATPSPASRRSMERAGIRLLSYHGEQTWLASVSHQRVLNYSVADTVARYPGLGTVSGIGLLQPKNKLSPQLEGVGDWAYTRDGRIKLTVRGFPDADLNAIRAHVEKNGAVVLGEVPALRVLSCAADDSQAEKLADHHDIRWVAPAPPLGEAEAGAIRQHIDVNLAHSDYRLLRLATSTLTDRTILPPPRRRRCRAALPCWSKPFTGTYPMRETRRRQLRLVSFAGSVWGHLGQSHFGLGRSSPGPEQC